MVYKSHPVVHLVERPPPKTYPNVVGDAKQLHPAHPGLKQLNGEGVYCPIGTLNEPPQPPISVKMQIAGIEVIFTQ